MMIAEISLVQAAVRLSRVEWNWDLDPLEMATRLELGASTFEGETRWSALLEETLVLDFFKEKNSIACAEAVVCLREIAEVDSDEYEDAIDDFFGYFNKGTNAIAEHLGQPTFSDGAAASGYPADQDATWISLWPLKTARLMLQVRHEGMDVPMTLSLVVAPPGYASASA